MRVFLILVLITQIFSGCLVTGPGTKFVQAPLGKEYAVLYLYRKSKFKAAGVSTHVRINDVKVGNLVNGSYLMYYLTPGTYSVNVEATGLNSLLMPDSTAKIRVLAERDYFMEFGFDLASATMIGSVISTSWSSGMQLRRESIALDEISNLKLNNSNADESLSVSPLGLR